MTQEKGLIETYNNKKDLYATIASNIYKKDYWECMEHWEDGSPNPDGKALRSKAKQIVLGISYGMGAKLLSSMLNTSIDECKQILDEFYKMFPGVKEFTKKNEADAKNKGYVEDYMGRRRHLPDAQLPDVTINAFKDVYTDADVFLNMTPQDTKIKVLDKDKTKQWENIYNESYKGKGFDSKVKFKELAKESGIDVLDNGAFISKTLTQCTNARIQGCLSGETFIQTKELGIKHIKDIVGKNVHVWDGKDWTTCNIIATGLRQKCIITFSNGQKFICSQNHLFKVVGTNSKTYWKRCDELKFNYKVATSESYKVLTVNNVEITNEFIEMYDICDTERGYYVADGLIVHNSASSLTKKAMVLINNDEKLNKLGFKLLIPVHDELLGECPAINAEIVGERLAELMISAAKPECSVDMKVDTYVTKHWYADEVMNSIQNDYLKKIKTSEANQVIKDLCAEHSELSEDTIKQMCEGTFDLVNGELK